MKRFVLEYAHFEKSRLREYMPECGRILYNKELDKIECSYIRGFITEDEAVKMILESESKIIDGLQKEGIM
nr:MAG TPA: hypothetical protein [Caudoviricetes sp.]